MPLETVTDIITTTIPQRLECKPNADLIGHLLDMLLLLLLLKDAQATSEQYAF